MLGNILEISVYVPGILEIPSVSVNTGIVFSELPISEDYLMDGADIIMDGSDQIVDGE